MLRTKVVNDSTDLIPLIRAFDNPVKKAVFKEIQVEWKPLSDIKDKYGDNGEQALELFDQMKLVETKWTTSDEGIEGRPQKKYRSYYSAFMIFERSGLLFPFKKLRSMFATASSPFAIFIRFINVVSFSTIVENSAFVKLNVSVLSNPFS